jgi:ribokinase
MKQPSVLVAGSANVDLVARVARCPRPGETSVGRAFETVCGGKGANQAVAAARLGARTWFAGRIGDDDFGRMQRASLENYGVDVSALGVVPGVATGTAMILVGDDGQNMITVIPGANERLRPGDIGELRGLVREADIVVTQLETPLDTVEALLALAREEGTPSLLDIGLAIQIPDRLVELADIVSPNETEAEALTGVTIRTIEDARRAATRLRERGARRVALKLGGQGALYMEGDDWLHVSAFKVDVVDTVAAGDAFTAGLAVAWARSETPADALRYANATGGLAATKPGAQASAPSADDVARLLASS